MAREVENPQSVDAISRRLFLLRKSLGYSQVVMAQALGQSISTWAMYETAQRRISTDHALRLCNTVGASMDWIYRGELGSVRADLAEKIQVQMAIEAAEQRKLNRRRS